MRELGAETEKGSRADGRGVMVFATKLLARNRKLKENGPQMLRRKESKSYHDSKSRSQLNI